MPTPNCDTDLTEPILEKETYILSRKSYIADVICELVEIMLLMVDDFAACDQDPSGATATGAGHPQVSVWDSPGSSGMAGV